MVLAAVTVVIAVVLVVIAVVVVVTPVVIVVVVVVTPVVLVVVVVVVTPVVLLVVVVVVVAESTHRCFPPPIWAAGCGRVHIVALCTRSWTPFFSDGAMTASISTTVETGRA